MVGEGHRPTISRKIEGAPIIARDETLINRRRVELDYRPPEEVHGSQHLWTLEHPRFEDTKWEMLASYRKLIFVRHPLERVVSAYRDKLEDYSGQEMHNFHVFMKQQIEDKFGVKLADSVSFTNFVRFIVAQGDDEMVLGDAHWISYHQLCNPCTIEYDFIGKFEHVREDTAFALRWLGAGAEMEMLPEAMHPTAATNHTPHYLALLSTSQRKAFLAKYFLDFISFDYSFLSTT
ncbi:carbohydrate sulfotransferase 11-like [Procambarus clarkii]|uniref:carbohydrate sulfotransferase 11-like n=1 Tax=Procambarus clarkii TaxID=6728 RepID=UPI0037426C5A